ncbi:MAG: hypothetical protein V4508_24875 [Pseudomonadota bacterium]
MRRRLTRLKLWRRRLCRVWLESWLTLRLLCLLLLGLRWTLLRLLRRCLLLRRLSLRALRLLRRRLLLILRLCLLRRRHQLNRLASWSLVYLLLLLLLRRLLRLLLWPLLCLL